MSLVKRILFLLFWERRNRQSSSRSYLQLRRPPSRDDRRSIRLEVYANPRVCDFYCRLEARTNATAIVLLVKNSFPFVLGTALRDLSCSFGGLRVTTIGEACEGDGTVSAFDCECSQQKTPRSRQKPIDV